MKAEISHEKFCDVVQRKYRFKDIVKLSDRSEEFHADRLDRFHFNGVVKQELIDLVAMRMPLNPIYVSEDGSGSFHVIGDYANDLLTTIVTYLNVAYDDRPVLRRVEDTEVIVNIIRCNNATEKVDSLVKMLKRNEIIR